MQGTQRRWVPTKPLAEMPERRVPDVRVGGLYRFIHHYPFVFPTLALAEEATRIYCELNGSCYGMSAPEDASFHRRAGWWAEHLCLVKNTADPVEGSGILWAYHSKKLLVVNLKSTERADYLHVLLGENDGWIVLENYLKIKKIL